MIKPIPTINHKRSKISLMIEGIEYIAYFSWIAFSLFAGSVLLDIWSASFLQ